jgi:hypothetical protein
MWFLYLLSWLSTGIQICFVTMAIAAGLYYLAELVEEYTVLTAKIIRWMIILSLATYVGLFLFESLPVSMVVCGIIAQVTHLALLARFPFFSISSPNFVAAMVMVLINHYLAFSFFGTNFYPFAEVMAYFTICQWMVPFAFFVSLSINENVLPMTSLGGTERSPLLSPGDDDVVSNYFNKKQKGKGLLSVFNSLKDSVTPAKTSYHKSY